ncbi:nucleotidyltransferase MB21D2-like [Mytilus californianus]|uniref:nucleotidyltransferase MB21D2-like n=1 Tax=Mytilus californianus TaxID=6549 RepID=UPI00224682C4|nr:nucleotidyltransferase MB21D2-like [Mytilus californianus]
MCLHCTTWISQASQWITRSNNSWPSYNVKQSILKHGVLFVPIGVKGSPKEDIEWRISFSVGEKFLINTLTHNIIGIYTECENLLCSYFLKTIIFWISEELPQSIWKPENLIHCFMRCFRRLIYSVDYSVCLHYFIPENNMFENKIEGRAREILLEKLYTLHIYDETKVTDNWLTIV